MTLVTGSNELAVVPPSYIKRMKEDDVIQHLLNDFADEDEALEIQEKVVRLADDSLDFLPTAANAAVVLTSDNTLEEETQAQVHEYLAEQAEAEPSTEDEKEDDVIEHLLNGLFTDEIQEKVALLADNIPDDLPIATDADVVLTSDITLEEETQVQEYLAEQVEAEPCTEDDKDHYLTQEEESSLVKIITEDLLNTDRLVIVHAYRKLAGLCHDWDVDSAKLNREMIYSLGGHTIIVLSMKRHPRTFKIQAEGMFHFLRSFS
jgi:hypothetical protein